MNNQSCGRCLFWNEEYKKRSTINQKWIARCKWGSDETKPESYFLLPMYADYGRNCKCFEPRR